MNNDGNQSNYWKPEVPSEDNAPLESQEIISSQPPINNESQLSDSSEATTEDASIQVDENIESQTNENENTDVTIPVDWIAPEYFVGAKGKMWYFLLGIMAAVFIAVSIFLFQSYSFAILVLVMAIALVVYTKRPPQEIKYTLSVQQGLYIGDKLYNLQDYKSFSIVQNNNRNFIELIPIKRFSPALSVYFPQDAGERIVDILASRLPMEQTKPDIMDKIIEKLRI